MLQLCILLYYILNYICHVQHLYILLYNDKDLKLIFQIFIFKFFFTNITDFCIFSFCFFVNNFIFFFLKLIIFITYSLKNSQNFFMQSLPLYASWIFSMLLNEDSVDIEKPDGICSLNFVADKFSGLFLHTSTFCIMHSRSA